MEVRRLYYEDPHCGVFTATVTSCRETREGFQIMLDATAFYPEGGGQPCDLGMLGDARVLDVQEAGEQIVHLCDRLVQVGAKVTGTVDWERRFDLMQQHTGEHIVSGIVHRLFGCHNVGFHMGADVITIDFDYPIAADALPEIERQANQAVFQNLPVECRYPSEAELPNVDYRRKKDLPWPVRIVQIPGYDTCACCGVHVKHTGQIGIIKLLSCVKFHQGVRMEMLCGGRALALLGRVYEQNRQVSQAFSAKILETGEAAQKMKEMLAAEKFRAAGLQKKLMEAVAASYTGKGDVVHFAQDLAPAQVRVLADRIAHVCGGVAAVFCGSSFCLVSHTGDVRALGQALTQAFGGRGGGKDGVFQGSLQADPEQVRTFLGNLY